jgi:hypothetical protein
MVPYLLVSILDMVASSNIATALHYVFCFIDPVYLMFGGFYYIDRVRKQKKKKIHLSHIDQLVFFLSYLSNIVFRQIHSGRLLMIFFILFIYFFLQKCTLYKWAYIYI